MEQEELLNEDALLAIGFQKDEETGGLHFICQNKTYGVVEKTVQILCIDGRIFVEIIHNYLAQVQPNVKKEHQTIQLNIGSITDLRMVMYIFSKP